MDQIGAVQYFFLGKISPDIMQGSVFELINQILNGVFRELVNQDNRNIGTILKDDVNNLFGGMIPAA